MGDTRSVRIQYVGIPEFASLVGKILRDEGVQATWEQPEERRGLQEIAQDVAVDFFCTGTQLAIAAAVKKIRQRVGRRGTVEIEDESTPPEQDPE